MNSIRMQHGGISSGAPENAVRDQELILRFFTQGWRLRGEHEPMTAFLDGVMLEHQDLDGEAAEGEF